MKKEGFGGRKELGLSRREFGGMPPVDGVQFAQDVAHVSLDGMHAQREFFRNLLVGRADGDEVEHLALAGR